MTAAMVGGAAGAGVDVDVDVDVDVLEQVVVWDQQETLRDQAATPMLHRNGHSRISIRRVEPTTIENGDMTRKWRKLVPVFRRRHNVALPRH